MFEWQTERNAKKGSIKEGPARGTNHRTEIRLREGKWHPMERGPSRAQRSAVTWRCSLLLPKDVKMRRIIRWEGSRCDMPEGTEVQTGCLASEKTELNIFSESQRGRADGAKGDRQRHRWEGLKKRTKCRLMD